MQRTATAVWNGTLKDGKGSISTPSGTLSNAPYSFLTRFENAKGTNPEELIGAAHAGCFAMALSAQLSHSLIQRDRGPEVDVYASQSMPQTARVTE